MPARSRVLSRLDATRRLLLRELSAFGAVGIFCFGLDLTLFSLLYTQAGTGPVVAKLVSTLVSTTVAFVGHRYVSFSRRARTGLRREYLLFWAVNGVTLLLGLAIVAVVRYPLGQESAWVLQAANVASIGVGTVIRFVAYRGWVFPAAPESPAPPAEESAEASPARG
jgi:putative flippase GtrA